jgi:hypothetical protein
MKNIFWLLFILVAAFAFNGCDEEDEDPSGARNVGAVPLISNLNPAIFDSQDLEGTFVKFDLSFPGGENIQEALVVGSYNGGGEKVEIVEVSSFPSTIQISAVEAASKLGLTLDDINNGDVFTFEVYTTTADGVVTTSNSVVNASVACAFTPSRAVGAYNVVSADWGAAGQVTLTADPDDPYTIYVEGLAAIEGLDEDQGPLEMHIDPLTYDVEAVRTVIASDYFGYTNGAFEGDGKYNSCDGSYVMLFEITVDQGSFGSYEFVFTRIN